MLGTVSRVSGSAIGLPTMDEGNENGPSAVGCQLSLDKTGTCTVTCTLKIGDNKDRGAGG